jgi:hypothetical protein
MVQQSDREYLLKCHQPFQVDHQLTDDLELTYKGALPTIDVDESRMLRYSVGLDQTLKY